MIAWVHVATSEATLIQASNAASILAHFLTGANSWDLIRSLCFDWSLLRQRKGCLWGFLSFHALSQYMAILPLVLTIISLDAHGVAKNPYLGAVFQGSAAISLGNAYSIFTVSVVDICQNHYAGWIMAVLHGILWITIVQGLFRLRAADHNQSSVLMMSIILVLSTSIPILSGMGVILGRKRSGDSLSGRYRQNVCRAYMDRGGHLLCAVSVVSLLAIVVALAAGESHSSLTFSTGYFAYSVTIACACRLYWDMTRHCTYCPVLRYCEIFKLAAHVNKGISGNMYKVSAFFTQVLRSTSVPRPVSESGISLQTLATNNRSQMSKGAETLVPSSPSSGDSSY